MKRACSAVLASLVTVACSNEHGAELVGTLERDRLELTAEANEPIVEILVREGDHVKTGARLLRLASENAQARLDQSTAAVAVAERRLAELVKGPRAQEISEARAALEGARSAERTANDEFARIDELVERHLLSQSERDRARAVRDNAAAQNQQAAARLNLLLEGTRREAIEQAEAELKRAQAALTEMRTSFERHVVTAPREGVVEALPYKLGERPAAGASVIVMLADGAPYARIYIPEHRRNEFSNGTSVRVRIDGADRDYAGRTRFVSAQAQFTPYYALTQEDRSNLSYLAEIDLPEETARSLPTGIPVQVTTSNER